MNRNNYALVFGLTLIAASIFSFIFGTVALTKSASVQRELATLKTSIDGKISESTSDLTARVDSVSDMVSGGGLLEQYISAGNYLKNSTTDLDAIITELQSTADRPYFRIFVAGTQETWIGFKKHVNDEVYAYQKAFKPGLSTEKFYYFKDPLVQTNYTVRIGSDASIRTATPEAVYLIFTAFNSGKLVNLSEVETKDLAKSFNLYIPGQ